MSNQESAVVSAKWMAKLDLKFAIMTSGGDLSIFDVLLDNEDQVADSLQVTRIH
jgi:hypothetical protein